MRVGLYGGIKKDKTELAKMLASKLNCPAAPDFLKGEVSRWGKSEGFKNVKDLAKDQFRFFHCISSVVGSMQSHHLRFPDFVTPYIYTDLYDLYAELRNPEDEWVKSQVADHLETFELVCFTGLSQYDHIILLPGAKDIVFPERQGVTREDLERAMNFQTHRVTGGTKEVQVIEIMGVIC